MEKKTKFYLFLGSIIALTGVILYFDTTNQQDTAETLALATVGSLFIVLLALVLFSKKKIIVPASPIMSSPAPAPTIKQYSFY